MFPKYSGSAPIIEGGLYVRRPVLYLASMGYHPLLVNHLILSVAVSHLLLKGSAPE